MTTLTPKYDAIVVGAGLAGLFCSLWLQKAGMKVLLIEQRSFPGGLCGTKIIDGYEFVIACNDFGQGMEEQLQGLNIPYKFKHKKTQIYYQDVVFCSPPNWRTILAFLSHPLAFGKFVLKLKQNQPENNQHQEYIEPVIEEFVKDRELNDLLKIPAYMMGVTPKDILLEAINYDSYYKYGYFTPRTPHSGPQELVNTLVQHFQEEKVNLKLNTRCIEVKKQEEKHIVVTDQGEFRASYVVSSQPRYDLYPPGSKIGMKLSMFLIAVDKTLPFPDDVHTMIYYPPEISQWYEKLDSGHNTDEFGFHIFKSDLPEKADHYTMNVYFYLPRGIEEPSLALLQQVESYIFDKLEKLIPGLNQALKYKRFISPQQFTQLHGLSSCVTPVIPPSGFKKPDNYDAQQDIYYIGNSVYPSGDHAGASILSAKIVANKIIENWQHLSQPVLVYNS
ncbi:phytoene desaturase family protein [Nodularia sp. NIES-3585]|uniref:phytoene desaturase family protein n=1 Tax=Nodularia sp. NIES-3585 TaxID=1973477 RepID=UPI000B5C7EF6|nr:FAD-dependent oxidoreductase [Nodularia sp. NIES-3585]GAX38986.1 phytoene dehydrogenase-related protein [Nodularia sp. NIES-3585]